MLEHVGALDVVVTALVAELGDVAVDVGGYTRRPLAQLRHHQTVCSVKSIYIDIRVHLREVTVISAFQGRFTVDNGTQKVRLVARILRTYSVTIEHSSTQLAFAHLGGMIESITTCSQTVILLREGGNKAAHQT